MRIIVIGGTGLIGTRVVERLAAQGHDAVAASPSTGVDALTGVGLEAAVVGADVVVDVANVPPAAFDDAPAFFRTSTANLLRAEAAAGVAHHVALSIVGIDRAPKLGYFAAKLAQEALIREGAVPWSIVRATQFFEFVVPIADGSTRGDAVHVGPVDFRPVAADDVAAFVAETAVGAPTHAAVDLAGPDRTTLDGAVRQALTARGDDRTVVPDPAAGYFGTPVGDDALVPTGETAVGPTRFADWLRQTAAA